MAFLMFVVSPDNPNTGAVFYSKEGEEIKIPCTELRNKFERDDIFNKRIGHKPLGFFWSNAQATDNTPQPKANSDPQATDIGEQPPITTPDDADEQIKEDPWFWVNNDF